MILKIICFPLWIADMYNSYMNSKQIWNEERATEILNYYVPHVSEFDEENNSFYFYDNGLGWSCNRKKYIKHKDRRFWKVNSKWFGGNIRKFLIEKFELEGFTKEVKDYHDGETEIIFIINKEV